MEARCAVCLQASLFSVLLALASSHRLRAGTDNAAGGFVYDYSRHGQDWNMASCASRSRQSPIDFPDMNMEPSDKFFYSYEPVSTSFELSNTGTAFSINVAGLGFGGLTYEDAWYNLLAINAHAQSEHTYAGQHRPLELHLVHKRYDGDAILIVAISIDTPMASALSVDSMQPALLQRTSGHAGQPIVGDPAQDGEFNAAVEAFLRVSLPPPGMKVAVPGNSDTPLDLGALLLGGTFFEYAGSLTAPPCAEIATWLVRKEPVAGTQEQVRTLEAALQGLNSGFGNYRMTMPLNGRSIGARKALPDSGDAAQSEDDSGEVSIPAGPGQEFNGKEEQSMQAAQDALKTAQSSIQYVKELDQRIHREMEEKGKASASPAQLLVAGAGSTQQHITTQSLSSAHQSPAGPAEAKLAESIKKAAQEAVADAMKTISVETRKVALNAAREAAAAVVKEIAAGKILKPA